MITFADIRIEHGVLGAWLTANAKTLAGTPEFRKRNLMHCYLNLLVERNGGTAADQVFVAKQLKLIETGEHPSLAVRRG